MTLPSERWERLKAAFAEVDGVPAGSRASVLAKLRPELASIALELDMLLRSSSIESLTFSEALGSVWRDATELPRGTCIGSFEVLDLIGRGGMAWVYEAWQSSPARAVALKIVFVDELSVEARRRFEVEAAALASLVHPNVAQVYECGVASTELGAVCFLAMERVAGARTLTEYVRQQRPDRPQVLGLFARVCDAVHFGHQRGVIHRDIKPANILVDQRGEPKLIDFGVARVGKSSAQTVAGQLVGTLGYMSPEQLEADPSAIDVRTDVYALGVVLFEALTGKLPYELSGLSWSEALVRVRSGSAVEPLLAQADLPADLRAIVTKALHREQSERYASACDLAADVRRFVGHQPVAARPPSPLREMSLLVRRHRGMAVALLVAVCALFVGSGVAIAAWLREGRARTAEQQQRQVAEETIATLRDALMAATPTEARGRTLSARDLVASAADQVARRRMSPLVEAAVRDTLGNVFHQLGDGDRAGPHLHAAVRIFEDHAGPDHPETLAAQDHLVAWLTTAHRLGEALSLGESVVARRNRNFGPRTRETLVSMTRLAAVRLYRGELDDAGQVLQRVAENAPREGRDPDERHAYFEVLALLLERKGDYLGALAALGEAESASGEPLPADHPKSLHVSIRRSELLTNLGRFEEAEELIRSSLDHCRRVFGEGGSLTASFCAKLALVMSATGRAEEALPYAEIALANAEAVYDPSNLATVRALDALALVFVRSDRNKEAAQVYGLCFEASVQSRGLDHPNTRNLQAMQGVMMARSGEVVGGLAQVEEAYGALLKIGSDLPMTFTAMANLATVLEQSGDIERSLAMRRKWLELRVPALGVDHPDVLRVRKALQRLEASSASIRSEGK